VTGSKTTARKTARRCIDLKRKAPVSPGLASPLFQLRGGDMSISDPGNDEENALWVSFEEDVAVWE
jgi:hypothetical protein